MLGRLNNSKYIFSLAMGILAVSMLSGCLAEDDKFDALQGGDLESVDRTTITNVSPDVVSVVIQDGNVQTFSVVAKAPAARKITYRWTLNGTQVQNGESTNYTLDSNTVAAGSYTLIGTASDGVTTDSKTWSVKINGPPVLTKITTGTPKVSVGSTIPIQISATDPNGDPLTYSWKLNGVTSAYLTGTTATATLAGNDDIVGSVNIEVTVTDDSNASATETWTAEINYFPMACNELATNEICTYAGSPSVGNNANPTTNPFLWKLGARGVAGDGSGNLFLADEDNDVVWFWNKSASTVTIVGSTINPNSILVVAGTGEAAAGSEGVPAKESALNNPRSVYYHSANSTLYIADTSNNIVRMVDTNGTVYNAMGAGIDNTNDIDVYTSDCNGPTDVAYLDSADANKKGLYVSCASSHRVKRWNFDNNRVYNVAGNGTAGCGGDQAGATANANLNSPQGIHVDENGVYIAVYSCHRVRFVNHSGAPIDFFGGTAPAAIANGNIATIMGSGTDNITGTVTAPLAQNTGRIRDVIEKNGYILTVSEYGNNDRIIMANNTGSNFVVSGGNTITSNNAGTITNGSGVAYNGSNITLWTSDWQNPYDIIQDPDDTDSLLISDTGNRRIRRWDMSNNRVYDYAGSGYLRSGWVGDSSKPSQEHLFTNPSGVVFDNSSRKLFFVDRGNGRIREVDAFGRIQTVVGRGAGAVVSSTEIPSALLTRFNGTDSPQLALFDDGSLLYVDRYLMRVWNRLTSQQTYASIPMLPDYVTTILGASGTETAGNSADLTPQESYLMNNPDGIAVYGTGTNRIVFFADTTNHCIKQINNDGEVTTLVGNMVNPGVDNSCSGVAGNGANGSTSPLGYGLDDPSAIAVDADGGLYIADRDNHKIRYFNRTASAKTFGSVTVNPGQIATISCATGASTTPASNANENIFAISARCNSPRGIAVNSSYYCYSNTAYHNVRCVHLSGSSSGRVFTVAGSLVAAAQQGSPLGDEQEGILGATVTSAPSARLINPKGVAFDSNGDLYIADWGNHIIRKVKLSP